MFDMSSTSGYMGAIYFQEFGPTSFHMSSASGCMGAKYFQELSSRFLACHVPNVARHGVSISIVSISSVSCRVRILRVSGPCHVVATLSIERISVSFFRKGGSPIMEDKFPHRFKAGSPRLWTLIFQNECSQKIALATLVHTFFLD